MSKCCERNKYGLILLAWKPLCCVMISLLKNMKAYQEPLT